MSLLLYAMHTGFFSDDLLSKYLRVALHDEFHFLFFFENIT